MTKLPMWITLFALVAAVVGTSSEAQADRFRGGYRGGYVRHYAPVYRWHHGYRAPIYVRPAPVYIPGPVYAPRPY